MIVELGNSGNANAVLKQISDAADGQAAETTGLAGTIARLLGWNGATFDRLRAAGDNADALAAVSVGVQRALAEMMVYNGATFDRWRDWNVFKSFASTAITAGTGATIWT